MPSAHESVSADFPDGVAVVFGGSGGMGREICRLLGERGVHVAFTFRSNWQAAVEVEAMLKGAGRKCLSASVDASDLAAVQAFFSDVAREFTRIHTVIVATGANIKMRYVADVPIEEWCSTIQQDLTGFFNICSTALPNLRAAGGSICVTTSAALARHSPKDILSTAPKAGIEALVRGIAREEGRFGIRANSVALGVIDGGIMDRLWEQVPPAFREAMKTNIPLRRLGQPTDIAEAVLFLASSRAGFITGQRLIVDGGYSV